ncbi:hypoxanthine-guanine phosphoribosyltransferase-like [Centruroides vittatus]|uniref:hypoxanthine-guanine phosphoribosyltransferase-like n=1 Tax=Centruroides vittatus TaxID=120091 RepID=UPI00350F0F32
MSHHRYIVFPDDYKGYSVNFFCIPKHYEDSLECILIPSGIVQDRVERLARDIVEDFGHGQIVVLCVLKGGYKFFTDLLDKMKVFVQDKLVQIKLDFIRLKSYEDDQSKGTIDVIGGDNLDLEGKNVLIVEDVIDTGKTIQKLLSIMNDHKPKNIRVASLLVKRTKENTDYRPEYCGFEVPGRMFVVGYAIDYNEYFRDLNHICVVNDYGKKKFGSKKEITTNKQ